MRIAVIGATGPTGAELVTQALAAGHDVTAVARTPSRVTTTHPNLSVAAGDVTRPDTLAPALAGADAVVCCFGVPDERRPGTLMSTGIANVVAACRAGGVRRVVFQSGLMAGRREGLSPLNRFFLWTYQARRRAMRADKQLAERTLMASGLDWVIVRPVVIKDQPAAPRGAATGVAISLSMLKPVAFTDVAAFLLRAATDRTLVGTVQSIGHR